MRYDVTEMETHKNSRKEFIGIRRCRDSEIKEAGLFYDRVILWLNDHINYPRWIFGTYPSEQSVRRMMESRSQYLCIKDSAIIGAFALSEEPQGDYQSAPWKHPLPIGSYLVLHALAVDPSLQRTGLGSKVLQFAIQRAKEEGYRALRADIVPDNLPARKLFEKNGFVYAGDADLKLKITDIPAFSLYEMYRQ